MPEGQNVCGREMRPINNRSNQVRKKNTALYYLAATDNKVTMTLEMMASDITTVRNIIHNDVIMQSALK